VFFSEAFILWLILRLHYQAKIFKLQNTSALFMEENYLLSTEKGSPPLHLQTRAEQNQNYWHSEQKC